MKNITFHHFLSFFISFHCFYCSKTINIVFYRSKKINIIFYRSKILLENTGGIMPSRFLKTHYRRGASVLTPEQIEEIRCLKNKVPAYMIVRNYHINKDRVSDIWNDCERLQQSGEYVLADMLPEPSNHDDIVHFKGGEQGQFPLEVYTPHTPFLLYYFIFLFLFLGL